jgi:hypothetical protein
MAAQQEERKRRASIDQSSGTVKEALDIVLDSSSSHSNIPSSSLSNNSISATTANTSAAGGAGTAINPILNTTNTNSTTTSTSNTINSASEDAAPVIARKLNEIPKKPKNPRRHSDSPYHTMGNTLSANDSYESLGIELQNDVLQKRLSEILIQQQKKEKEIEQEVPSLSKINRSLVEDGLHRDNGATTVVKNRKRSSTSPPSSQ